ncbi:MAG: phytoene desaturase family protein [Solirubrobacterales bacterium]
MSLDAVIVGAGHNGLVTANYLARSGLSVEVLESREVVGGACVTEEVFPGFRASTCSYVVGLLRPEIIRDLELKRFGLDLYQAEVLNCNILPGGEHVFLWKELDRTLRELDALGSGDAEAFVEFGARVERFAALIDPFVMSPAPRLSQVVEAFERAGEQELFNDFFTLSVRELLDRHGFSAPILRGLLAFLGIVSVHGGPSTPGTAYVYGHHSWGEFEGRPGQYGFARGGMSGISDALAAGAEHHGARIRTGAPVRRVIVDGGAARGVELESGEEVRAPIVISNADPQRTYLSLVDADDLPADFVAKAKEMDMRGSEAHLLIALDGVPDFTGFPAGVGPQHLGLTLLGAEEQRYEDAHDAQRHGVLPEELSLEFAIDSVRDDSLTPPGKHLMNVGLQQVPTVPSGATWDELKPEFTRRVVATLAEYAPGFENRVIDTKAITPLDLERDYGLTGGNIFHGAMTLGQLFDARPLPSLASYGSPIHGLYLCGAGTHPGGGVMGANGHNAAQMILRDRSGEPQPTRPVKRRRADLMTRSLERPAMRRLAVRIGRQRWSRPLTRFATKRRGRH